MKATEDGPRTHISFVENGKGGRWHCDRCGAEDDVPRLPQCACVIGTVNITNPVSTSAPQSITTGEAVIPSACPDRGQAE